MEKMAGNQIRANINETPNGGKKRVFIHIKFFPIMWWIKSVTQHMKTYDLRYKKKISQ